MRRLRLSAVALPLALAASASCSRSGKTEAPVFPGAPVVVVSVDTLRSDRLPFYGYTGVETPALSALRRDAVLFEKAFSPAPLTLPAHASLLTGLSPAAHGLQDNLGYRLPPETPTLAALLRKEGYRTGGAVSAFVLGRGSGIEAGFDFFEDGVQPASAHTSPSLVQRSGAETADLLARWVESQQGEKLLAFLHLYEPHTPYDPPEPHRSRYASNPYDGEIARADEIVGAFLARLKARGLYDKALVVFLSDHGESLGEHGEDEHGIFVYRATLQVPLLVKLPRGKLAGTTVSTPVQLQDVFTTVAEAVGVRDFRRPEGTESLLALAAGAKAPERILLAESHYPRIHYGWASLASALDGRWHYVGAPRPEFFDMEKNPGETEDLAAERPGPFRAMALAVEKGRSPFRAPDGASEEERKKLVSLGYLSTGAPAKVEALPDPKDEIGTVRTLREAVTLSSSGRPREALPLLEELLKKNPAMTDVWELYANALAASGRFEEALRAMRRTVELSPPGATIPLLAVANLCLQGGLVDEARKNAELALARGDSAAHEALARIRLATGDLAGAESAARAALDTPRVRRRAELALAHVAARQGNTALALTRLDALIGSGGADTLPGVRYLRGDLLARASRWDEAARDFREEIRLFPFTTEPRVGLALVQSSRGEGAAARQTLSKMVEEVGTAEAWARAYRGLVFLGDRAAAERLRAEARRRFPEDASFRTAL